MSDDHTCPNCNRTFGSRDRMRRHAEQAHGGAPDNPWVKRVAVAVLGLAVVAAVAFLVTSAPPAPDNQAQALEQLGVDGDPALGNDSAPVHVVAFETPKCPACRSFHQNGFQDIKQRWIANGDVQAHFQQFQVYPYDEPGGIAQECVHEHEGAAAFWNYTDWLYDHQDELTRSRIPQHLEDFADREGANGTRLVDCYEAEETRPAWQQDMDAGRSAGFSGTPGLFVVAPDGTTTNVDPRSIQDEIRNALEGA